MRTRAMDMGLMVCVFVLALCPTVMMLAAPNRTAAGDEAGGGPGAGGRQVGSRGSSTPLEAGMQPLYIMTETFLNLVQSKSDVFILDKLDIVNDIEHGSVSDDINLLFKSLVKWQIWVEHYIGYVVCAAVGIVFIVFMPLIGLCMCCCRCCCGKCGGGRSKEEGRRDRCARNCCSILLFTINTLMLAGMVCAFVTNELLRQQTAQQQGSLLNNISDNINSIENFKRGTVDEFKMVVKSSLDDKARQIIMKLQAIPEEARSNISALTDSGPLLLQATSLAESAVRMNESLTVTHLLTTSLQTQGQNLKTQVDTLRTDILNTLRSCPQGQCSDLKQKVTQLDRLADFTKVDDVSSQLSAVQDVLNQNLLGLITQGNQEFGNISTKVDMEIGAKIKDAVAQIQSTVADMKKQVDKYADELNSVKLNGTTAVIQGIQPKVEEYGNYRYYAGIGLSSLLLLIVLFNYLGLCFGASGEHTGEDAPACNMGVGATVLMVSVTFMFLFSWLLMLVTMVTFLSGGVTYTEICRPMSDLDAAPPSFKKSLDTAMNELLSSATGKTLDLKLTDVLSDCRRNTAVYQALHLDQVYNLSTELNLQRYNVRSEIEKVIQVNINLGTINIISAQMRTQLDNLANSKLENIDFISYERELNKSITTYNLTQLAAQMNTTADQLSQAAPGVANQLRNHANQLQQLETMFVVPMFTESRKLDVSIKNLKSEVEGSDNLSARITKLVSALVVAQDKVNTQGSTMINKFIKDFTNSLYKDLVKYTDETKEKLETTVGRCRPIYEAVEGSLTSVCVSFLDAFNGFWFSFGWCLFFFIPTIIICIMLVSYYRRTMEFYDDKASFDNANYDAYTGVYPGDNIPLEDMGRRHRSSQGHRQGHGLQNTGYEREDYATSQGAYPYGQPMEDSYNRNGGGAGGGGNPRDQGGYRHPPSTTSASAAPPHYHGYNNRGRMY